MKTIVSAGLRLLKYLLIFAALSLCIPYLFKSLPFVTLGFLGIVVVLVMKRDLLGSQAP
ncbi:MAG: hypothetical protein IGS03_01780 [Candidatus Sericytochromatia bacterium]|nr:hypothetical protein [Candidatus Sericytochromatia bacterium]